MTLKKIALIGSISFLFMLYNCGNSLFARPQPGSENEAAAKPAQASPAAPSAGQKSSSADENQDEASKDEKEETADQEGKDTKEAAKKDAVKKELTAPVPVLEIKRLENESPVYSIELRNVELSDLFRVIAHDYNLNILVDKDIQGKITASFTNISLEEALEGIAEISNLVLEKKGSIIKVSPNLITRMVVLKYIQAKKLLESAKAAQSPQSGGASTSAAQAAAASGSESAAGSSGAASAEAKKEESTIYDLISEKGKILLGQVPNSIIVIDYPPYVARIAEYLQQIDQRMTSKVFKMKYLKASDVVGAAAAASATSSSTTSASTTSSTSSSTSN
jgi:type II secretory pathway component GspD/PulD (secretin)